MKITNFIAITILATCVLSTQDRMFKDTTPNNYSLPPFFTGKQSPSPNKLEICTQSYFERIVPGYPIETHKITTEDGYILTAFRIQAKGTKMTTGKPAVFLQHGINDTGFCFFFNDEDKALGTMLANAGFDVWIGNTRGNKFSRAHKTLDINKKEFWEYSFMQMGQFDVPANLQYVKDHTGVNKVAYIGHSQGTSQMFAALSDPAVRPKLVPNLSVFYALAPVVYLVTTIPIFKFLLTNLEK